VLDGGTTDNGRPYFIMEYVKGVPITKYCDDVCLPIADRLALFVQVCQAVQHAHQKGIIHRDLKPSNILVCLYDGKPVPKVIDFGLAKAMHQPLSEHTVHTAHGILLGTPLYMSPEQAEFNNLDIDTRSDIYSLGVILYELLTGTTPLERKRIKKAAYQEMLRLIKEDEPLRPSARLSGSGSLPSLAHQRQLEPVKLTRLVRGELDWIVMKSLEKERSRRYETANGLARDIQRYLTDEAVEACPPSAGYRLKKFARKHRTAVLATATLFLLLAAVIGCVGWLIGEKAARQADLKRQVQDSLTSAQALLKENQVLLVRQKLAEARGLIGTDPAALAALTPEIEAFEEELNRLERFFRLVDKAHQAEITLESVDPKSSELDPERELEKDLFGNLQRQPAKSVPFLLEALASYQVLEPGDWSARLETLSLENSVLMRIRETVYEEVMWLAKDSLDRRIDHHSGQKLAPEAAARATFDYLKQAELARHPTQAFYQIRALAHQGLLQEEAARADFERASREPSVSAFDHYQRGLSEFSGADHVKAYHSFEAALRLNPNHFWSMMMMSHCCTKVQTNGRILYREAALGATGCIMKRNDYAPAYVLRGFAYSRNGLFPESIEDFQKAIELDPHFVEAWIYRGLAYSKRREFEKALADLSKAIEAEPRNLFAWQSRGNIYSEMKEYKKALADYSKAIEITPKYMYPWYYRGLAYLHLNQYEQAISDASKVIELKTQFIFGWHLRGKLYRLQKAFDKSLADLSKAIEIAPKNATGWFERGETYQALNQGKEAVADYSKAITFRPNYTDAWHGRGQTYAGLQQRKNAVADFTRAIELAPKKVSYLYDRAAVYLKMKQLDLALADYAKAMEINPMATNAWRFRGEAYYNNKQFDKAIADYTKVLELKPSANLIWRLRGDAFLALKQFDRAIADYTQAIEIEPTNALRWCRRGDVYFRQKLFDKAIADYTKAIEFSPKDATYWGNRANAYREQKRFAKAIADYTKALELNSNNSRLWTDRGFVYALAGQRDKAFEDFAKALEPMQTLHQSTPLFWSSRGYFARQELAGLWEFTVTELTERIKADSKNAGPHNVLAWLLAAHPDPNARDSRRAVELAKKAVALQPKNDGNWNTLGAAYYRAGEWQAALDALANSNALRTTTRQPDGLFFAAMAEWQLGHKDEAHKLYKRATDWLDANEDQITDELRRFRIEAAELLDIKQDKK
jgi:tetratricopeptide (TPR) repeat protein